MPGAPSSAADFTGNTQLNPPTSKNPISVDAVYDGNTIIHVLINENCTSQLVSCTPDPGKLYDHPFDITTNTSDGPSLSLREPDRLGLFLGSGGVSGLFDRNGVLHVAYWAGANRIDYAAFTYDSAADMLTQVDSLIHVDSAGGANHPILAVSPLDGSVTIAWISQATNTAEIPAHQNQRRLGRHRTGWPQRSQCACVDQHQRGHQHRSKPVLIITANRTKHLAYIQDVDSTGEYGHVHYVTYTPQTAGSINLCPTTRTIRRWRPMIKVTSIVSDMVIT